MISTKTVFFTKLLKSKSYRDWISVFVPQRFIWPHVKIGTSVSKVIILWERYESVSVGGRIDINSYWGLYSIYYVRQILRGNPLTDWLPSFSPPGRHRSFSPLHPGSQAHHTPPFTAHSQTPSSSLLSPIGKNYPLNSRSVSEPGKAPSLQGEPQQPIQPGRVQQTEIQSEWRSSFLQGALLVQLPDFIVPIGVDIHCAQKPSHP